MALTFEILRPDASRKEIEESYDTPEKKFDAMYYGLMHFPSNYKYIEMVRFYLERGANINHQSKSDYYSPIEFACVYYVTGHPEMLNLLLEYGARFDKKELLKMCSKEVKAEVKGILNGIQPLKKSRSEPSLKIPSMFFTM